MECGSHQMNTKKVNPWLTIERRPRLLRKRAWRQEWKEQPYIVKSRRDSVIVSFVYLRWRQNYDVVEMPISTAAYIVLKRLKPANRQVCWVVFLAALSIVLMKGISRRNHGPRNPCFTNSPKTRDDAITSFNRWTRISEKGIMKVWLNLR
jgi:hypothetical protein